MAPLGPFGPGRRVAVAVSGGADSMALALLAAGWGRAECLVVDHGLRADSAKEAALAVVRLAERGLPARVLTLCGLKPGPSVSARARDARYAALTAACRDAGIVDLLLGHHLRDQAETVLMRVRHGSGAAGLAGMTTLAATPDLRLLRPLLGVSPYRLRATVRVAGLDWSEDPSNTDLRAERARVRLQLDDPDGIGPETRRWAGAARQAGAERAQAERLDAAELAGLATLRPDGIVHVTAASLRASALSRLLQAVSGADYPTSPAKVAALAARLGPATLGGVRVLRAGALGPGWLLVREEAAMAGPVPARPGALWDRRFRLGPVQAGQWVTVGGLGADAAGLRRLSALPAAALRTLPALRRDGRVVAVPHLAYPDASVMDWAPLRFAPSRLAAGSGFVPACIPS